MRLIHLPTFWTILIDIVAWLEIHMGVAHIMVRIPAYRFDPANRLFRIRPWEKAGRIYHDLFKIKIWKKYLPDGSPLLGEKGFPKKKLLSRDHDYFAAFLQETCRAELTHLVIALFAPLFFLWNSIAVGLIMIFYAAAENLPLIMAQRYNRCRFGHMLARRKGA